VDVGDPELADRLAEWEFYFNWHRPHSSLGGKTPSEKYSSLIDKTPFWEEVAAMYNSTKERIILQNYRLDTALKSLKQSL
jgi:Integrase core domain